MDSSSGKLQASRVVFVVGKVVLVTVLTALSGSLHFLNVPHIYINNRPLKTSLSYTKLKLNRRVGRWRKPVLISRWPIARFAESRLLHVRTTTSFA
jgi:hypothetical protein